MQELAGHSTEQAWLAAIVAHSQDAIIAKDLEGVVTGWNAAAERLFGYDSAEMLGRPLTVIFPASRLHEETSEAVSSSIVSSCSDHSFSIAGGEAPWPAALG